MAPSSLTPAEYEAHLKDLRDRLNLYLEKGEGNARQLLKDAEHVLELADEFAGIFKRYEVVEGLVAEILARRRQQEFLQPQQQQSPGCVLGWLLKRGKKG